MHAAIGLQRGFDRKAPRGAASCKGADELELAHDAPTEQAKQFGDVLARMAFDIGQQIRAAGGAGRRNRGRDGLTYAP